MFRRTGRSRSLRRITVSRWCRSPRWIVPAGAGLVRPGWRAADLELLPAAPSFTSRTLEMFHERGYLSSELFFVIGADAFADIASWRDYPNILDAAHFAVVSRPGFSVKELPRR